jgi:hypothetical protein
LRMKLLVDLTCCCLNFLWCLLTMALSFQLNLHDWLNV